MKYGGIEMQHLLSYKNCAESTITTLESQALILREVQLERTVPEGLLEAPSEDKRLFSGTKAAARLPDFKPSSKA